MKFKNSTVLLHIGFTVAILTLVGIFGYAGISFNALIESNEQVSHTLFIQQTLDETLHLLTDAETSQRGYVITGDEAFLEPYTTALDPQTGIRAHLAELRELTSDNPSQQERLGRLERLVEAKLEYMQEIIDLRDTSGFETARETVASGRGREQMDTIRALIREMHEEESALLQSRSDAALTNLQTVRVMFGVSVPVALAMLMAIFSLLADQIRKRRRAQESLQKLNAELEQCVTERTAALAESEHNYRLILSFSPLPILTADAEGRIKSWNKAAERLFGWTEQDALGKLCPTVPPDGIEDYRAMIRGAMEGKAAEGWVRYRQKSSGASVICNINASAQRNPSDETIGVTIILEDITERRRAEVQLRESEERFRRFAENSPAIIYRYRLSPQPGFEYVSPVATAITGYTPKEHYDDPELGFKLVHPDDVALLQEAALLAAVSPGKPLVLRWMRKDGTIIWTEQRNMPIHDELGNVVALDGMAFDITERKRAEEALRQSEEQYRSLFEDSPVALWVEDFSEVKRHLDELKKTGIQDIPAYLKAHPDFVTECARQVRILDVNGAAMKMYHARQKSELLGSLPDTLRSLSLEQFARELIQIANGRLNFAQEKIDHTLTGEKIYVNMRWSVAPGYEDSLTKVIVSTLDITERKRAEEELTRLAHHNTLILDSAGEGIYGIDLDGKITFVNPVTAKMFGEAAEDLMGLLGHTHHHHTRADGRPYPREECLIYAALRDGDSHRVDDEVFWRKDGSSFPVEYISTPIRNEHGEVTGAVVTFRDITERRQADAALRASEERYRSTLDNMLEGVQMIGYDWRYLYMNDVAAMHGQKAKEELLGHTMMEMYPGIENTTLFETLRHCMEEKSSHQMENEFIYPDGSQGWFDLNIQSVPEGLLILSQDITARKRAEEDRLAREVAERASQAKSEFLSRMSHELRTPMNSILGFAQLLMMDQLTPDQTGSLEQILKSGRHLLNLINEVLDIARIESGRVRLSPEPVHVAEALEQAVDLIRPLADERRIRIEVRVPSSRDVFVTADRQRLRQVLLNLLSNAVKYNREHGEVHVTASLLVDGFLHLAVRDTGEGIAPEKTDRLFVAFDRLGIESTIEGTGLGLALSKGLVEAMGGRMGAQSVVGEGSTFWFDLELTTQQKEHIVMAEVDDFLKASPSPDRGLVLYVEDNLSNIQLIEKVLARLPNVKLISAMQGRLAMDLARQHKPDLILLDMHLPDVHGEEVLKWLKAEPETREIPVVVMSADATQHQIERALTAGAHAYLTKPIDVKEFLKIIGDTLGY